MKLELSSRHLLFCATVVFAAEMPSELRSMIAYQTPEEWKHRVVSSHVDILEDGRPDSELIGIAPLKIAEITKILVCAFHLDRVGTRLTKESIYSAMSDFAITPPGKAIFASDPAERWIEVTGTHKREYRIIFLNGIPSELYLRKDGDTLVRFGLERKKAKKR